MRILVAAAEALPFYKTGGLGDVARSLPDALVERGHDVRVIIPGYSFLNPSLDAASVDATIDVPWPGGGRSTTIARISADYAADTLFVRTATFFDTERPYDELPSDELALGRRFAFFCRAVAAYARAWQPDIVHLNDWQTGLVPLYGLIDGLPPATLYAIHNLAYQGNSPPRLLTDIGVPPAFLRTENGVEFHGQASFMKGGIALADRLVTVSPTYAREIQTPEYGNGLDGLLSFRRRTLHGVLNGIDTKTWNPASDTLIPVQYNARTLARKAVCRAALLEQAGIEPGGIVLGMVSRLAHQKGIDLLIDAVPGIAERFDAGIIILGNGDRETERRLRAVATRYRKHVHVRFGFDESFAHLIYAGADAFLMPSLYEPCGLGQMIAQRYGTPPIARRTGGLNDTIQDGATGFLFDEPTGDALVEAVGRADNARRRRGWRSIQMRCMREDHSWTRSAHEYEHIYRLAMGSLAT